MSPLERPVAALAPAKVNPWLAVRDRRPDGFHEVDLGLLALDLADRVEARAVPGNAITLMVGGPAATDDVPADERNLAWRAARGVLELAGESKRGVALSLTKHVPSRAGLGGGSSNAAAAALAVREALGLSLPWEAISDLLADLGSDCVFFLDARATGFGRCTGRGEIVHPLAAVPAHWRVVVLVPDVVAATAEVYGSFDPSLRNMRAPSNVSTFFEGTERVVREAIFNDLEPAALAAVPGLPRWRELLDGCGCAHFRLSGSGSSFFGVFEDPQSASHCLSAIETAVRERGMSARALQVTRPAGHGARLSPVRPPVP